MFSVEEESELKDCILKSADLGFPLTLKDIGELVESFVNINNVETAKNILKYVPRYNATKNPLVVYHLRKQSKG